MRYDLGDIYNAALTVLSVWSLLKTDNSKEVYVKPLQLLPFEAVISIVQLSYQEDMCSPDP